MAATAAIWTQHPLAGHLAAGARPMPLAGPAGSDPTGSDPSSSSATISANDFLTLLVTEMQNQDPTDETDPNEYIDQLVQVNSLEQLIDINQTLSAATGGAGSATPQSGASPQVSGAAAGVAPATPTGAPAVVHPPAPVSSALGQVQAAAAASAAAHAHSAHSAAGAQTAPGNLSMPAHNPAAQRVAHALGGMHGS